MSELLHEGTDGRLRCWWPGDLDDYTIYHDEEWGRPTLDDDRPLYKDIEAVAELIDTGAIRTAVESALGAPLQ